MADDDGNEHAGERHTATRLRESERRLNAVLDNATVAVFLMDDRQRCVYMNRAAEELTGFTLDEVLVLDRPLHDIIHHTRPDGRPFPLEECAIDRAFPENDREQGEEVFVHKDGHFYPVAFTASPIRDEAAQVVGTIIEVRDIRAEKVAQAHQRRLINELNHRVKNTLAAVQSITMQTFRGPEHAEVLELFNSRLLALSMAHTILTDENWESAGLRVVVEHTLAPFDLTRFVLDGPDHRLNPKFSVALAMVLHELATNAAQHGALRVPSGRIELRWMVTAAGGVDDLHLHWLERGGPPVTPPARRGFGTRLLERQFALEFGAAVKFAVEPTGVDCTVDVRLPPLGEAASSPGAPGASGPAHEGS
ncbi:HWE histidine kinase domain-containing protein [Roseomonas genomospecies 6]|uniref:HWE histidine kinase domain-containing protein n=1 Tax=Roseomonas genomospecies 6 TaxID=214106 RepID=UPI001AD6B1DB|nr:HWE histidine kinase domain-containing protein [Roseomonas genomospecies 6]